MKLKLWNPIQIFRTGEPSIWLVTEYLGACKCANNVWFHFFNVKIFVFHLQINANDLEEEVQVSRDMLIFSVLQSAANKTSIYTRKEAFQRHFKFWWKPKSFFPKRLLCSKSVPFHCKSDISCFLLFHYHRTYHIPGKPFGQMLCGWVELLYLTVMDLFFFFFFGLVNSNNILQILSVFCHNFMTVQRVFWV